MTYGAVAMGLFSLIQQHSFTLEFTPRYGSLLYLAIFGSRDCICRLLQLDLAESEPVVRLIAPYYFR